LTNKQKGQDIPSHGKGHCFKLAIFRCLLKNNKPTPRKANDKVEATATGTTGNGSGEFKLKNIVFE